MSDNRTTDNRTAMMPISIEREVFRYASHDGRCVRIVVSGPITSDTCEALEAFITQRRDEMTMKEDQNAR